MHSSWEGWSLPDTAWRLNEETLSDNMNGTTLKGFIEKSGEPLQFEFNPHVSDMSNIPYSIKITTETKGLKEPKCDIIYKTSLVNIYQDDVLLQSLDAHSEWQSYDTSCIMMDGTHYQYWIYAPATKLFSNLAVFEFQEYKKPQ